MWGISAFARLSRSVQPSLMLASVALHTFILPQVHTPTTKCILMTPEMPGMTNAFQRCLVAQVSFVLFLLISFILWLGNEQWICGPFSNRGSVKRGMIIDVSRTPRMMQLCNNYQDLFWICCREMLYWRDYQCGKDDYSFSFHTIYKHIFRPHTPPGAKGGAGVASRQWWCLFTRPNNNHDIFYLVLDTKLSNT